MGLKGKLITQSEINCNGDIFHELIRHRPHHVASVIPDTVQSCDLHEGEFGRLGSVLFWNYTHEEKKMVVKTKIEAIDEEKKLVTFNITEGDVLELYKKFIVTMHIDTNGDKHVVTWTFEYEKKYEEAPAPTSYIDLAISVTKGIEDHHAKK
ncbi:hypothetical protein RD792_015253 [Penstemon davidsonii]|uniref:Bet v I/Major latex protein domain-containing protein n=1 Tax=Penstemon davidsonii TaxID=160366 RepID=A0ABR0CT86_9LAMI|nr:hypothetical protein RD792_015253 [Penstemon davidsonii]